MEGALLILAFKVTVVVVLTVVLVVAQERYARAFAEATATTIG